MGVQTKVGKISTSISIWLKNYDSLLIQIVRCSIDGNIEYRTKSFNLDLDLTLRKFNHFLESIFPLLDTKLTNT